LSDETPAPGDNDIIARLSAFQEQTDTQDEPVAEAVPPTQAPEAAPVEEVEAAAETDEQQPEQPEETDSADNLVDIEFDGKVLKGSPELREAVLRHADYTRKTTELAEHRALFQKEREIADQHAAFNQSIEPESTELAQIDAQLAQFKALPWDEFDMQQSFKAKNAQDLLKERKAEIKQAISAKRDEFTQQVQQSRQELIQTGIKYLNKVIPSWGKDAYELSAKAAKTAGYTEHEVANFVDPRALHLAWKAAQWDKLQAAKPAVQKKVSEVPPVTKPGSQATTESKASSQYKQLRDQLRKTGDPRIAQKLFALGK